MTRLRQIALLIAVVLAGAGAGPTVATEPILEGSVPRAQCDHRDPLKHPFFGDLHVHTVFSLDASTMGTRNRPADAYRFARGETLGIQPYTSEGEPMRQVQLERPLDFAAVTDHAELFGEWKICNTPGLRGYDSLVCRLYRGWPRAAFFYMNLQANRGVRHDFCGEDGVHCLGAARGPWLETQEAAEAAYDRSSACRFTTFTAYEWTGAAGTGNNFHRNVVFANDIVPEQPVTFLDGPLLSQFWSQLNEVCSDSGSGCESVVIPHNSNLSGGKMFATTSPDGSSITATDARQRSRNEVLVEMMQHKGDSECMLEQGSEDELCSFEKLSASSFGGLFFSLTAEPATPRQFVRNALREGLVQERALGINPFKFGIIASSDTHLATPGLVAESASFPGHGGAGKPPGDDLPQGLPDSIEFNPGGLAVVWAEENSRSSLSAALRRRETYGTSGPRMVVRFFGGWDYPTDLCESQAFVSTGYARGVAMGSDLPQRTDDARRASRMDSAPIFAVSALADPGTASTPGMPLQRIQIVKGWLDGDTTHERVYDVAGDSEGDGRVDVNTCKTSGAGAASLCSVWIDPDFASDQSAFYYARVIENPSCRWSQKLCLDAGIRCDDPATMRDGFEPCCSDSHHPIIQERAWSSPIWYRSLGR